MPSQCRRGAVDGVLGASAPGRSRPRSPAAGRCGSACDPPLPSDELDPPVGPTTSDGAIIDATRWPGATAWKPSGWRSSSPIMLLAMTPVPGISQPDPSPFEVVMLATLPSASRDADVGRAAGGTAPASELPATVPPPGPPRWPPWPRPAPRRGRRTRSRPATRRRSSSASSPSATSSPPNAGGGLVSRRWPRQRDRERLALDDRVRREVGRGQQATAAAPSPRRSAGASPGAAKPRSSSEPRNAASAGLTRRSPTREQASARGHDRRRLGGAGEDRLEDPQEVGLLLVHLDPVAGEAAGRAP